MCVFKYTINIRDNKNHETNKTRRYVFSCFCCLLDHAHALVTSNYYLLG